MRALRSLAVATFLAAANFGYAGATLAQTAPPAGQDPHHPPAQGQAAPNPAPGGGMGMMGGGGMADHMAAMMQMMSGMRERMTMMQMMDDMRDRMAMMQMMDDMRDRMARRQMRGDGMGPGGMPSMPGGMRGMMDPTSMGEMVAERTEGRLAFIKAELAITEAQSPVWNAYADAVRAEAKRRPQRMPMAQAVPAMTWVDRLTRQEQDLEQRLESLRRLKGASSALYAALSATQKKTADEILGGPMGRM